MSGEAGSAGTPRDGYKVEPRAGKHRAPPLPPKPPDAAWWTVAAAAGALTVASVVAVAVDVAPDARSSICSPASTEGEIPCPPDAAVDASGLALTRPIARPATSTSRLSPTSIGTVPALAAASTRPPSRSAMAIPSSSLPSTASGQPGSGPGSTSVLETTLTLESPSSPDVTPPPQTVTTQQAATTTTAPPAATTTPDAPEETPTVTPEPTATTSADVTVEVAAP